MRSCVTNTTTSSHNISIFCSNQPEKRKYKVASSRDIRVLDSQSIWTFEPGLPHRTTSRLGDDRADQLKTEQPPVNSRSKGPWERVGMIMGLFEAKNIMGDSWRLQLITMHLKTVLTPVALAAVVGATSSIRDVEPCAQVSKLVEDANQDQSTSWTRNHQLGGH